MDGKHTFQMELFAEVYGVPMHKGGIISLVQHFAIVVCMKNHQFFSGLAATILFSDA